MSQIIQTAVFPKIGLCSETRMYFRHNKLTDVSLSDSTIRMFKGGTLLTNTYFNSLSISKLKKHTSVDLLSFSILLKGSVKIIWKTKRLQYSDSILQEDFLQENSLVQVNIDLSFWQNLEEGMLYFEIQALDDSEIQSFQFVTNTNPLRNVKLGIVITHFNRMDAVLSALTRLKEGLLSDLLFKDKISICIIDNSQNLPEIEGITIIPNENLGGSGGFTRGLIYLKHTKGFSHCLFMDDDASCEIESIKRTLFYLENVKNENTAIAGAMLREIVGYFQHENGGIFDGICVSVKQGYQLLLSSYILKNDLEERIDYGAWWYFAFPIDKVKYLSFPYFVRGDDISFSLANKFDILTLNGVCSWQIDFVEKTGALQLYLDQRNHIMHFLHNIVVGGNKKKLLRSSVLLFILNALTYQYESAKACTLAIEDILKGPEFWRQNVSLKDKRKEILEHTQDEKIQEIPVELLQSGSKGRAGEYKFRKIIRVLSFNGHLIPNFFFKKDHVWQYKHHGGRLREVFLYPIVVLLLNKNSNQGLLLKHSKKKFFGYSLRHAKAVYQLFKRYDDLKKQYVETYPELTSEAFWMKQFKLSDNNKE